MSPDGLSETSAVPVGDHWHGRCHFSGLLTGWPVLSVWLNMGSLAVHIIVERDGVQTGQTGLMLTQLKEERLHKLHMLCI